MNSSKTCLQENILQNEKFKIELTQEKHCKVSLNIETSPKYSIKIYKEALKKINKEVSLPGFRKGKVPEAILMKNFKSYVHDEWKNMMVNQAFKDAIEWMHCDPIQETTERPVFSKENVSEGACFTLVFEHHPIIDDIDISLIKLEKIIPEEVSPESIEQALNSKRDELGKWKSISDRPIQADDIIEIDIFDIEGETPKRLAQHQAFKVSEGNMGEWMRTLVLGKNVGDTVEGVSQIDPNASEKIRLGFHPTKCKIDIKAIKIFKPAELDEALAKRMGHDSIEDLKVKIGKDLEKAKQHEAEEKMLAIAEEQLIKLYPFDVPNSMYNYEHEQRLKAKITKLHEDNLPENKILEQKEAIEKETHQEVTREIKSNYIFSKLAIDLEVKVSEEELNKGLNAQLWLSGLMNKSGELSKDNIQNLADQVTVSLRINKTRLLLLDKLGCR